MSTSPARVPSYITCRCGARWTALGAAHCGACHCTFSAPTTFDQHRSTTGNHGTCRRPADLTNNLGERSLFLRDGIWRGPELTDEEKASRFGNRKGTP